MDAWELLRPGVLPLPSETGSASEEREAGSPSEPVTPQGRKRAGDGPVVSSVWERSLALRRHLSSVLLPHEAALAKPVPGSGPGTELDTRWSQLAPPVFADGEAAEGDGALLIEQPPAGLSDLLLSGPSLGAPASADRRRFYDSHAWQCAATDFLAAQATRDKESMEALEPNAGGASDLPLPLQDCVSSLSRAQHEKFLKLQRRFGVEVEYERALDQARRTGVVCETPPPTAPLSPVERAHFRQLQSLVELERQRVSRHIEAIERHPSRRARYEQVNEFLRLAAAARWQAWRRPHDGGLAVSTRRTRYFSLHSALDLNTVGSLIPSVTPLDLRAISEVLRFVQVQKPPSAPPITDPPTLAIGSEMFPRAQSERESFPLPTALWDDPMVANLLDQHQSDAPVTRVCITQAALEHIADQTLTCDVPFYSSQKSVVYVGDPLLSQRQSPRMMQLREVQQRMDNILAPQHGLVYVEFEFNGIRLLVRCPGPSQITGGANASFQVKTEYQRDRGMRELVTGSERLRWYLRLLVLRHLATDANTSPFVHVVRVDSASGHILESPFVPENCESLSSTTAAMGPHVLRALSILSAVCARIVEFPVDVVHRLVRKRAGDSTIVFRQGHPDQAGTDAGWTNLYEEYGTDAQGPDSLQPLDPDADDFVSSTLLTPSSDTHIPHTFPIFAPKATHALHRKLCEAMVLTRACEDEQTGRCVFVHDPEKCAAEAQRRDSLSGSRSQKTGRAGEKRSAANRKDSQSGRGGETGAKRARVGAPAFDEAEQRKLAMLIPHCIQFLSGKCRTTPCKYPHLSQEAVRARVQEMSSTPSGPSRGEND